MQQANRWRWRPDYEGVDLPKCRCGALAIACGGVLPSTS